MTQTELIKLSERVAELYGVPAFEISEDTHVYTENGHIRYEPYEITIYLHEDLGKVFKLAIENGISFENGLTVVARVERIFIVENLQDNNNDKVQATIVAIMKALISLKVKP